MSEVHPDVLVVGAGPVGLCLGIECLRHGATVRLIEKRTEPSEHSKALAVWSAAQESLASMGCIDGILKAGIAANRMRIFSEGRELAALPAASPIPTRYPEPIFLPQSSTEQVLAARFIELGGTIERGVELTDFEETGDRVESRLRIEDGSAGSCRSRWLVGCDGAHSTVRHRLGLGFDGESLPQSFVLCDAALDPSPDSGDLIMDWSASGVLAVFPVRPGVWRIITDRPDEVPAEAGVTAGEMHGHLERHGRGDWKLSDISWLAAFNVSERKVDQFRVGRVMVAGDAAHIHSPAGGQGMNLGMQDAFNLGWKLGLLATDRGNEEALLSSYHDERSPMAEKVLKGSGALIRLGLLHNPFLQKLRNAGLRIAGKAPVFRQNMAKELSGLSQAYTWSEIIDDDSSWHEDWRGHGFCPGSRVRESRAYCPKRRSTLSIFDEFDPGRHTLLLFSGIRPRRGDLESLAKFEREFERVAGGSFKSVRIWQAAEAPAEGSWLLDSTGTAHYDYGVEWVGAYLIRPDNIVAVRAAPLAEGAFQRYAESVLIRQQAPIS